MSKDREIELSRSQFAEEFLHLKGRRFSLDHYSFLRDVYNRPLSNDIVLKFSRQCVYEGESIHLADNRQRLAKDLVIDDPVIGFDRENCKNVLDKVKDVWDNGVKPVYEIKTKTGRSARVTSNHLFLRRFEWIETIDITPGDLIALSIHDCNRRDKELVSATRGDLCFDEVLSVDLIDDLPTIAIETQYTSTFQINGLISHNTSKSTSLANWMVIDSAMMPHLHSLYVSPTSDQTKIFSNDRMRPVMNESPLISDHYLNSSITQNVFQKTFLNGSVCYLRYSLLSAERLRGISSDILYLDEAQDLRKDNIPIIQETMSRSEIKRTIYSGTPQRTQGTLADAWNLSTKNEFIIRCEGCNHWNILGEDNIGNEGVICSRCGKAIDNSTGQWVSTYDALNASSAPNASNKPDMDGYRVCLLHFAKAPWVDWKKDVVSKYENMKKVQFFNEVLAIEYDEGASPVTLQDIVRSCDNDKVNDTTLSPLEKSYVNIIGVDYGPINSEDSYTVISVVQVRADITHVIYAKKFYGKEADYSFIHKEIPRLMNHFNAKLLAADYGHGEASNSEIRSKVGYQKVIAFQHLPAQKEKVRWNPKMPAYTLNRNRVMTDFFSKVRNGKVVFPRWEDMKKDEFHKDILNVQMDFDEERNTMKYTNIGPDDFLHATLFASVAYDMYEGAMM